MGCLGWFIFRSDGQLLAARPEAGAGSRRFPAPGPHPRGGAAARSRPPLPRRRPPSVPPSPPPLPRTPWRPRPAPAGGSAGCARSRSAWSSHGLGGSAPTAFAAAARGLRAGSGGGGRPAPAAPGGAGGCPPVRALGGRAAAPGLSPPSGHNRKAETLCDCSPVAFPVEPTRVSRSRVTLHCGGAYATCVGLPTRGAGVSRLWARLTLALPSGTLSPAGRKWEQMCEGSPGTASTWISLEITGVLLPSPEFSSSSALVFLHLNIWSF